jgi:hypothetical protein
MDTIMRGAKTFSASSAHFDTVPTCWVSNISQRPNIYVLIFYYIVGSLGWRSKITVVDAKIFFPNQPEAAYVFVSRWEQSSDNKKCAK